VPGDESADFAAADGSVSGRSPPRVRAAWVDWFLAHRGHGLVGRALGRVVGLFPVPADLLHKPRRPEHLAA
jgi:hypothetical protein